MSLTKESSILKWIKGKTQGDTFTAADIAKDTNIPSRNVGRILMMQPEGMLGYDDGIWEKL